MMLEAKGQPAIVDGQGHQGSARNPGSPIRVLHLGTTEQGGISEVIRLICGLGGDAEHRTLQTHRRVGTLGKVLTLLSAAARLTGTLISGRTDIYHLHAAAFGSVTRKWILLALIKAAGGRAIVHVHGGRFKEFYEALPTAGRYVVRYGLRRVDGLIVLSPEWATFFEVLAPKTPTLVLPNAVELPAQDVTNPPTSAWSLAFLGKLNRHKGIYDLVRAVARSTPEIVLEIGGTGDVEQLRALTTELGIRDRVLFYGWVDGDQRHELLSRARALALPSYAEGLPMAVLEAMAHSLPVIVTPVGGIPSLIRHGQNGLIVEAGKVEELTSAINLLAQDPLLARRLGAAARDTVVDAYGVRQFEANLIAFYRRFLEPPPNGS